MGFVALVASMFAQDAEVQQVLKRYREVRPSDETLGFYRLDWAVPFSEAKARAAKESRPILFIWNRNISGPDNFYTGHC